MCVPIHSVCVYVCTHMSVPIDEHVYHSEEEGGEFNEL